MSKERTAEFDARCECPPCPGRGNDGHGMTHCAECCFGSGVEADIDCPTHGLRVVLDPTLSPNTIAFRDTRCASCGRYNGFHVHGCPAETTVTPSEVTQ